MVTDVWAWSATIVAVFALMVILMQGATIQDQRGELARQERTIEVLRAGRRDAEVRDIHYHVDASRHYVDARQVDARQDHRRLVVSEERAGSGLPPTARALLGGDRLGLPRPGSGA